MDTKRYCVYNKTTESFLSVGASVVDTTLEPLKAQQLLVDVENLTVESSFWLKPFKAIPVARIVSPFDMVFLDKDLRVIQCVELSPAVEPATFEGEAASALVLRLHTIYSSRTYPGDQFIICAAEELVRHLANVPSSTAAAPISRNSISSPEQTRENIGPTSDLGGDRAGKRQPASPSRGANQRTEIPAMEEVGRVEFQAEEIEAVISQVRRWSGEMEHPQVHVPIALTPEAIRKVKEAQADKSSQPMEAAPSNAVRTPPVAIDRPKRKQAASHALDESEKLEIQSEETRAGVEVHPRDIEAVVSQVLRWAEETGRPVARAARPTTPTSAAQTTASLSEQPGGKSDPAQSLKEDRSGQQQTAIQPTISDDTKKVSWMARFLRWSDELTRPLMRPQTAAGRRSESTGSAAGEAGEHRGSVRSSGDDHVRRPQPSPEKPSAKVRRRTATQHFESLKTRFVRWLDADTLAVPVLRSSERRRAKRHPLPGLVAYYWTGGTPQAHQIGDISTTGFYLLTNERWVPETLIRMTLQRPGTKGENPEDAISVISKVVRWGPDGVGYEFVLTDALELTIGKPEHAHRRAKSAH